MHCLSGLLPTTPIQVPPPKDCLLAASASTQWTSLPPVDPPILIPWLPPASCVSLPRQPPPTPIAASSASSCALVPAPMSAPILILPPKPIDASSRAWSWNECFQKKKGQLMFSCGRLAAPQMSSHTTIKAATYSKMSYYFININIITKIILQRRWSNINNNMLI